MTMTRGRWDAERVDFLSCDSTHAVCVSIQPRARAEMRIEVSSFFRRTLDSFLFGKGPNTQPQWL